MDKRFENLREQQAYSRNRILAFVLLTILVLAMLITNRLIFPVLDSPPIFRGYRMSGMLGAMVGIIISEFTLLSTWVVLSPQTFLRRILILIAAVSGLSAAWCLGLASQFDQYESVAWSSREPLYFFGFLPAMLLAFALPLIGLRFFASRQLSCCANLEQHLPIRQPISIAGIMTATGVVAFAIAAMQLPLQIDLPQSEIWMIGGVGTMWGLGIGLFGTLPAVLLLLSRRRRFLLWAIVLITLVTVGTAATSRAFFGAQRAQLLETTMFGFAGIVATTVAFGIIRLLGYRLVKARKSVLTPLG